MGTSVKIHHFTARSTPARCCPRTQHVWGTRAVRRQEAPTALLFEQVAQYKIIKIKFVASMIAVTPATASTKASLASSLANDRLKN
jgi:hypothetical protein